MAAFNIFFAHLKVFKYLRIVPSLDILWRALGGAAFDTWPFLFIFLLFTCGFTFAGHWIFGLMMPEFHTWPRAFATLFLTLVGGYPYDDMHFVAPISAWIFTLCWVLVAVMVLANMFVAILAEWYHRVLEERDQEEAKLRRKLGRQQRSLSSLLVWLRSMIPSHGKGGAGKASQYNHPYKQVRRLLAGTDLRDTEHVRKALLAGKEMSAVDLAGHFGGNARGALDFVRGVQLLAASADTGEQGDPDIGDLGDFGGRHEDEAGAQTQLKSLQTTVERLELNISQLRQALHQSGSLFRQQLPGQTTLEFPSLPPVPSNMDAQRTPFSPSDLPGVVQPMQN
jgi:hypothetical protein